MHGAGHVQRQIKVSNLNTNVVLSMPFKIGIRQYISWIRMETRRSAAGSIRFILNDSG